jgi:hypothetical protein
MSKCVSKVPYDVQIRLGNPTDEFEGIGRNDFGRERPDGTLVFKQLSFVFRS